ELGLIGREARAVGPMRDGVLPGENAVDALSGLEIDHVKTDVAAEANVAKAVSAVDRVREHPFFPHVLDPANYVVARGIKNRQKGFGAEIDVLSIEAHDAVVGLGTDLDALEERATFRADDQEAAVLTGIPPSRGNIDLRSIL